MTAFSARRNWSLNVEPSNTSPCCLVSRDVDDRESMIHSRDLVRCGRSQVGIDFARFHRTNCKGLGQ